MQKQVIFIVAALLCRVKLQVNILCNCVFGLCHVRTVSAEDKKCTYILICMLLLAEGQTVRNLGTLKKLFRGADKSLARPGRKQANVSVRMA